MTNQFEEPVILKTIKEFPEEKEWVKTRLAKIKEDELTMKSKRIK